MLLLYSLSCRSNLKDILDRYVCHGDILEILLYIGPIVYGIRFKYIGHDEQYIYSVDNKYALKRVVKAGLILN